MFYENCNEEQTKKMLNSILTMEYIGIKIEDVKNSYEINDKAIFYFSVPESSVLETENKELNTRIKTADDLIKLAKEELIDLSLLKVSEISENDEEFIQEIKDNSSDYFRFYAKVRTGEIWNKDLADEVIKKFNDEMEKLNSYKEV